MGSATSKSFQMYDGKGDPISSADYKRDDIGSQDLTSRYANTFKGVSILALILFIGLIVTAFYLASVVDTDGANTVIKWFIPTFLTCLVLGLFLYWFLNVLVDLRKTDILVTDLLRRTTMPFTDASFKKNLTELVASRSGEEPQDVYDSINNRISLINDARLKNRSKYKRKDYYRGEKSVPSGANPRADTYYNPLFVGSNDSGLAGPEFVVDNNDGSNDSE